MTDSSNKRNTSLLIIIAVLILIIAFLGYYAYDLKQQVSKDVAELENRQQQLEDTYTKLDSISKQLDSKIREIERLGGDVDSLLAIKKQLEKEKYELKLSKNLATDRYNRIVGKISNYEALLAEKDREIVRLRTINKELEAENKGLKQQKDSLRGQVSTLAEAAKELNSLKETHEALSTKVKTASLLKAKNVDISAVSDKGRERTKGNEFRAKHIDRLKISFILEENKVADPGIKKVYVKVIEPEGGTLFNMSTGAGKFYNNGVEEVYSIMQEVDYNNAEQMTTIIYDKGAAFKKGDHKVELYCDGVLIGAGEFTVK